MQPEAKGGEGKGGHDMNILGGPLVLGLRAIVVHFHVAACPGRRLFQHTFALLEHKSNSVG